MASSFQGTLGNTRVVSPAAERHAAAYSDTYKRYCHRVYSLAFWMTDNELVAEQLTANTFLRACAGTLRPGNEQIDQAFLAEVRELMPIGTLTLNCAVIPGTGALRGNLKRIHLERSVTQLPATERLIFLLHDAEGYEHQKIARLLGISEKESRFGLHQARVQIRELVTRML
jgi:RNA polymerase sigma-70 factor (ECF subfamily)